MKNFLNQKWKVIIFVFFIFFSLCKNSLADSVEDPCAGPDALLALLDRPTASDSACAAKPGHVVGEMGFQSARLRDGGISNNFPEAELRLGLPKNIEIKIILPNYFHQHTSGFGATTVGIKHEITYTDKWILTADGLLILPTGSATFGSAGYSPTLNGIFEYQLTTTFSITMQLGISSQTLSDASGGDRFTTFNPDFVLTWQPNKKLQFYVEINGQTKTAPSEGSGFNMDGGIQYLITPAFEIDAEKGVRISGNLGGFTNYFGVGFGWIV